MNDVTIWISWAFRFTLFGLFCYKLMRLFRSYATPMINKYVNDHKHQQMTLFEQNRHATSTKCRLNDQLFEQKRLLVTLEQNVHQWHKRLCQIREQQRTQSHLQMQHAYDQTMKRIAHTQTMAQNLHACTTAVQGTRKNLCQSFQTPLGTKRFNEMLHATAHRQNSNKLG